jgi:hypothetical protein
MTNFFLRWQTLSYILFILLFFGCNDNAYFEKDGSQAEQTTTSGGDDTDIGDDGSDPTDPNDPNNPNNPNNPNDPNTPNLVSITQSFQQAEQNNKIDFLWVVDNSGSMQDEQDSLAFNFETFIENFLNYETDFKMAIITTDSINGGYGEPVNGSMKNLTSTKAQSDEEEFLDNFSDYIKVGTNGWGIERGLLASEEFFEGYGKNSNSPFIRDDAKLAIFYISDEEDQSTNTANYYVQRILDQKVEEDVIISSIVNTSAPIDGSNGMTNGYARYKEVTDYFDGKVKNIKSNFHTTLLELSEVIIDKLISFELDEVPYNTNSILVKVNNITVQSSTYDYIEATNSIRFKQNNIPDYGDEITISYTYDQ